MWRNAIASIFCLALAQGVVLGQWTCDSATPVALPFGPTTIETMGPAESFGYWHSFAIDRPAVIEISGGPCLIPGAAIASLWSDCEGESPSGLVGMYETPDMETGFFSSGEIALGPGAYYLEYKTLCILDWDTFFYGSLQIVSRYSIGIDVLSTVNPRSRGVVPVAILGSESFDVSDIDVTTLAFGPNAASPAHSLTDSFTYHDHLQDVNYDGIMDLVTHYRTQDTGITCGDEAAMLTGETLDGQPIEGFDSIRTVGCRETRRPAIWMKDMDRPDAPRRDGPVNIERK
jgi:hypothetical protein